MDSLEIKYGPSKAWRYLGLIFSILVFIPYFLMIIKDYLDGRFDLSFYIRLVCSVLIIIQFFVYLFYTKKIVLVINNEKIDINLSRSVKLNIEWVEVSRVTMAASYITFHTNGGQKQKQLSFSTLRYKDVGPIKSKVIEICEHKNIPYGND